MQKVPNLILPPPHGKKSIFGCGGHATTSVRPSRLGLPVLALSAAENDIGGFERETMEVAMVTSDHKKQSAAVICYCTIEHRGDKRLEWDCGSTSF